MSLKHLHLGNDYLHDSHQRWICKWHRLLEAKAQQEYHLHTEDEVLKEEVLLSDYPKLIEKGQNGGCDLANSFF